MQQQQQQTTSGAVATAILAKKEKRKSWRDKNHQNPDEGPDNEVPDTSDTISQASFKSAYSKGMSSAKSLESITSINDTKSMITACSGDSFGNENDVEDDERALTPTESECTNDHLKSHLRRLKEENSKLKEEKQRLTSKHDPKDGKEFTLVQELQERLAEAENIIQDYRDENTVLKCELRDINAPILQNGNGHSNGSGNEYNYKLKETESLCEELMIENENLKSDIRDLQQEIEEMQDQYREEEIEEFRELQRELEQNAKNCRVLQFKLRKAERQRDSAETERDHVQLKLKEFSKGGDPSALDYTRQKELESELRIAKEVSVRLHNELEAAEEKRCKLEDEIFYYKEKCRELQTQHKWRETRNKADQAAKRHSQEIVEAIDMPTDELRKELRDVLERENDLREQLRFTEEDLKRSRSKLTEMENENEELLQKLVRLTETANRTGQRRPPITRSARMLEMEIDLVKKLQDKSGENGYQLNAELEKDLGRLMSTIHELEKKNSDLTQQLKKQSTTEFAGSLKIASAPSSPIIGKEKSLQVELRNEQEKRKELEIEIAEYKSLIAKSDNQKVTVIQKSILGLQVELRNEQEKRKELEIEIAEYKSLIAKSDNQKLIAMATKVELLQNQLLLANDRCNALHKKALKESITDTSKYADSLKQRCEALEKQLSEEKSNKIYEKMKKSDNHDASPTSDEIEHCCVVLASIEAQTNRLAKQVDKIDSNGQKDQRRRSLTLDNSAAIVGELANVLSEIKGLKDMLHNYKISNPNYIRESPERDSAALTAKICEQCEEKLKNIESMKDEIAFYKKKNKELTNQVLQTEDRWSREIEKQTHGYRSQIHALDTNLGEVQKKLDEQIHFTESINAQLSEKKRSLDEEKMRAAKLQTDLEEKQKALQTLEKEQHALREWEIKYKKLEKLFDQEKSKFDADRLRIKSDTAVLKKRTDEAVADLGELAFVFERFDKSDSFFAEKLRNSHQRREIMWNEERQRLEKEMIELREKIGKDSNNDF
uniref:Uncharacterized protein n=1 Tax=Panagrolaimus sp. ES5 TaxID=591445 RepID=A0AC34EZW9_9BILA